MCKHASESLLSVVCALRERMDVIDGPLAVELANLLHYFGLDSISQWGNAYFRCACGEPWDCTGEENWESDCVVMCKCERELTADDVRLAEGWVDRL